MDEHDEAHFKPGLVVVTVAIAALGCALTGAALLAIELLTR